MKKIWIIVLLCVVVFMKFMTSITAVYATDMDKLGKESTIGETDEEKAEGVSANIMSSRLLIEAEEDTDIKLQDSASASLKKLLADRTVSALIYLCDFYDIRQEPDMVAQSVVSLPSGHTVYIEDIAINDDGTIWYRVNTYLDEQKFSGYVERDYLAYSDEVFIKWEHEIIATEFTLTTMDAAWPSKDIAQFPISYQTGLQSIKSSHPNWTFVKMNTGLDWSTVIKNEIGERSLVPSSSPEGWKNGNYNKSWAYATDGIIRYYMDPRNFLNEATVFQFEQLTYNASYHTQSAVQGVLSNTFMAGGIPGDIRTYAGAYWEIGNSLGVSPFHLACRVYQEQGKGTSPLIFGEYNGYEGLYNYFNIGATGVTDEEVITNGLTRARKEGWTTRYTSLYGGAKKISSDYILKGQDTLYLQKFDVDSSYNGLYWHQYMQNICAPESEGKNIKKAYSNVGAINNTFVFKIPVYNNMPVEACKMPVEQSEQPPADTIKIQAFVKRLYNIALGRDSDQNGLVYWTNELVTGKKTGADTAKGFLLSTEIDNKNLSNEQYIIILYQTFFDRTPANGDSGKAFWINLLENGVSRAYVLRGFCHSDEFTAICNNYGISRGNIALKENRDQKHNLTMYVYRCYNRTLIREPDVKGLNYWTGQLLNKKRSPSEVAANFVFSKEFVNKKYSDEEYVKIMYRMFFDRDYDKSGLIFWLNEIESGNRDRYKVFIGFANSEEFKVILNSFGL